MTELAPDRADPVRRSDADIYGVDIDAFAKDQTRVRPFAPVPDCSSMCTRTLTSCQKNTCVRSTNCLRNHQALCRSTAAWSECYPCVHAIWTSCHEGHA
jgi:hypothetical protein